jgi:hypothetical protein
MLLQRRPYAVNGRFVHRLDADCNIVAEQELPTDGPYNGIMGY